MFTDNPSYFSLSGETSSSRTTTSLTSPTSPRSHSSGLSAFFRRKACNKMGAASSHSGIVVSESTSSMHHENRGNVSGMSTPTEERVPMLSRNGAVPGKRRSFRNLFRSVSANADHERTQKFLKGDPRPSDVAPPSPYLPHRSHSHSERDRHRPGRGRRVLKSASELLSNDMVYCGLTGNSKNNGNDDNSNDDDDSAEVFLGVDDAVQFCGRSCYVDAHCAGIGKCCPTRCGGSICSMPVTMIRPIQTEKPGSCPSVPTGRWVCSSTCNSDNDCRGSLKCCKNRCGALACQKPMVETLESVETPIQPIVSRFGNDYNNY